MKAKLFDSIEEFKKTCEFFAAGEKIPHRIAKIKGSITSCLSFGFDTWVAKTSKGYLCAVDCSGKNGGVIVIDKNNCNSFVLIGNPYSSGGITRWVGNNKINETSWLLNINKALDEMNT